MLQNIKLVTRNKIVLLSIDKKCRYGAWHELSNSFIRKLEDVENICIGMRCMLLKTIWVGLYFWLPYFPLKRNERNYGSRFFFLFYFMWLPCEKIISLKEAGKLIWYKYLNTSFTQLDCPYCIRQHATIWNFWHDFE